MYHVVAIWIATLASVHFIAFITLRSTRKFSKAQLRGLESRIVCGFHCVVSATGAAVCLKERFIGGLDVFAIQPCVFSKTEATFVAMELGELLYMTVYDLWYEPSTLELLHHSIGIIAESSCLYMSCGIPFMLWVHVSQATQPFLYFSWALYQVGMVKSVPCIMSMLTCVFLWFFLRIVSVSLLLRSMLIMRWEFSSQVHFNVAYSITIAFALLNLVWFKKLITKISSL